MVVNAVLAGKGNYGFNAANDTYGDMIEMGILDPTKVTRTALQNAASMASLMLTTEADRGRQARRTRLPMGGGRRWHGRHGRHGHGHVSSGLRGGLAALSCACRRAAAMRPFSCRSASQSDAGHAPSSDPAFTLGRCRAAPGRRGRLRPRRDVVWHNAAARRRAGTRPHDSCGRRHRPDVAARTEPSPHRARAVGRWRPRAGMSACSRCSSESGCPST